MADEEKEEDVEVGEEGEAAAAAASGGGGRKSLVVKILQISIGLLLLIIIIVAVSLLTYKISSKSQTGEIELPGRAVKEPAWQPKPAKENNEDFMCTLADEGDGQKHYVQVQIVYALEETNTKLDLEMTKRRFQMQSIINSILVRKRYSDLCDQEGLDRLKSEILNALNNILMDGEIKDIYFPKYIVQ